jgi:hypothetical protein
MTPGICAAPGFIRGSQSTCFVLEDTPGSAATDVGPKLLSRSLLVSGSLQGLATVSEDVCPELTSQVGARLWTIGLHFGEDIP